MAKRKHGKKSPSLNNKNKPNSSYVFEDESNEESRVNEAEFLKEEFANEYAEREHLIHEEPRTESTLKATDAPEVDLTAEVNVDLSLGLEPTDANVELVEIDSINLAQDEGFTLNLGDDAQTQAEEKTSEVSDEAAPVALEAKPEKKPTTEKKKSKKGKEKPAKVKEATGEVIGFDFGSEESDESLPTETLDTDSDDEAVTLDLSQKLSSIAEGAQPSANDAPDGAQSDESDEQLAAKKSKHKKAKKPSATDDKNENDTTIIDAVAKEMENEARQTLIQKTMVAEPKPDEIPIDGENVVTDERENESETVDTADVESDETLDEKTESESTDNKTESESTIDSANVAESDTTIGESTENEKGESEKERYTKQDEPTDAPTGEEEEYRRALALRDKRLTKAKSVFDFIELFVFTLAIVLFITTFFVRHSIVDGDSMLGTLENGQSLLISNFMYEPECGDIVVVEDHSTILKKPIVKRIIAVGGQTVKITLNGVYVDGTLLDEPYVFTDGMVYQYNVIPCEALLENDTLVYGYTYYEFVVPEGELFIMGDHRNMSMDSRDIGTVHADAILGKVLVRIAPFDDFKIFN